MFACELARLRPSNMTSSCGLPLANTARPPAQHRAAASETGPQDAAAVCGHPPWPVLWHAVLQMAITLYPAAHAWQHPTRSRISAAAPSSGGIAAPRAVQPMR